MYKVILISVLVALSLLICVVDSSEASDNVTLITHVVGDNATVHLITHVIEDEQHSYAFWWGCCGDGWGERNKVSRSTPLWWLSTFPNMITGIITPGMDYTCTDIKAEILRIEPSSVTVGTSVDVVFVVESSCNYVGNISLLVNGNNNQTLGVDLKGLRNRTYRTTVATSGLQSGVCNLSILGGYSTFNVVASVIPTSIVAPVAPVAPAEDRTEDNIIMWVAIAIGGIILVTIILLIILR